MENPPENGLMVQRSSTAEFDTNTTSTVGHKALSGIYEIERSSLMKNVIVYLSINSQIKSIVKYFEPPPLQKNDSALQTTNQPNDTTKYAIKKRKISKKIGESSKRSFEQFIGI